MSIKDGMTIEAAKREYIERLGTRCPVCGSQDVEGRQFDVHGGVRWQPCSCTECQAEWLDVYNLTEIDSLDIPAQFVPPVEEESMA